MMARMDGWMDTLGKVVRKSNGMGGMDGIMAGMDGMALSLSLSRRVPLRHGE